MTREEAIKMLKSKMDGHTDTSYEWVETVRMAINALLQVPIYRKKAKRWKRKYLALKADKNKCMNCVHYDDFDNDVCLECKKYDNYKAVEKLRNELESGFYIEDTVTLTSKQYNDLVTGLEQEKGAYNALAKDCVPMSVIEDIRKEIQNMPKTYPHTDHFDDYVKTNDVIAVIDRHIGKEQTE